MSGFENGNWHNANGGGLPYRPPTVDEALPYSPFTSVVPFSPDIIPFPSTEPPTPPTTLSPDQQSAAKKAVGILNEEIKGPPSTAQHLEHTLRELRTLLGNPHEMTEYRFKQATQLATPPPESPAGRPNGSAPTKTPALSPFASMLLRQTDVHYLPAGAHSLQQLKAKQEIQQQTASQTPVRTPSRPAAPVLNHAALAQNGTSPYKPSPPSSAVSSTPSRSGPAVVIKPLGPTARREEYQRYDHISVDAHPSQRKREERSQEDVLSAMRPQEREIGEQRIGELNKLVQRLLKEKEDPDESEYFSKASSLDSEVTVMMSGTMDRLYDKVMAVCGHGCFSSVPVETILRIHSLCEPSITATDQFGDLDSLDFWADDFAKASSGMKASKLVLTAMLQGRDDRRISPEDLIVAVIQALKHVLHSCIFPVLSSRRNGDSSETFKSASNHKDQMLSLLRLCGSLLSLLGMLIGKVTLTDTALTPIEFLALALVIQPNSDSEKDSVFGIQKFESLRQAAMEALTQIFASHPDHQLYIMTEILNNLEKLPDKGANARQYKSARDPPIMSVSALFMRFVQVAATNQKDQHRKAASQIEKDESAEDEEDSDYEPDNPSSKKAKPKGNSSAKSVAQRLMQSAKGIAARIASTLIDRALNVSKSGDKPFRNLLDMFVEDFCNVLGSPEWPAAVILLQQLLRRANIVLHSGNNRDMALTLMATMGCGIIDFRQRIKHLKRDLDISQSELSAKLDQLANEALNSSVHPKDLLGFKGPYRMVIESLPDYLSVQANQDDPHLLSVQGCYVTCWIDSVTETLKSANEHQSRNQDMFDLLARLENMIMDSKWLSREYKFQNMSEIQSRLASGIVTLEDQFCRYLQSIVTIMVSFTRESAATLKSRAIKSIESFLNKDPQIISGQAVANITHLFNDHSPLVRADAISLISKCLEGNPALERQCLQGILRLTTDPSNGPKKKAINLLKKMYLGSTSKEHRRSIAAALLPPLQDHEKPIAELARQALEEIWLQPLDPNTRVDESQLRLRRAERASLLVEIVRQIQVNGASLEPFEKFFAIALAGKSTNQPAHFKICKEMVADMIEGVISPESMSSGSPQGDVLQALSIFAKIDPKLFTLDQVQLLKLYVKDLGGREDLATLRPTVTIFRFVFPHLSGLQTEFAQEVQTSLTKVISKIASWASSGLSTCKETLLDVVHCLWIISPLTKDGINRLMLLISSTVTQLHPLASLTKEAALQAKTRITSYLILLGTFGKVCNLDNHLPALQRYISTKAQDIVNRKVATQEQMKSLLGWSGTSSSVLLLETVRPFTKQNWDLSIREHALCSVGEICQGSPSLFMRPDVEATFRVVFKNDNAQLQRVALAQFNDFFVKAERPSDGDTEDQPTESNPGGAGRLGITFVAGDGQVTTNYLARRFLPDIVDIALKNDNELAVRATNIITSISRQGLVHPKECGPALIALGTSPNAQIAQSASTEHKKIHDAHESMFEKEYMSAVRMAFTYQQEVCKDTHGMVAQTYKPKMLQVFNVLKGGGRKTLKKFIDNLCKQMDFELSNLDNADTGSDTVLFTRFCLENLALFDVPKLEDVAIMVNALENIVLKHTGPSVGVAIETEMPKQSPVPEPQLQQLQDGTNESILVVPTVHDSREPISDARLLQITRACMILLMMWEARCFVRRAYNLHNLTGRIPHKDYQKPASRNNLVSGKELWERLEPILNSTESRDAMTGRCYEFAELLEVDKDAKIGDEDLNGDDPAGYATPAEGGDDEGPAMPTSGRGRKRKSSASVGNTPKKQRARPKNKKRNSRTPDLDGWD